MSESGRIGLFSSAIVVVIIALIVFLIILIRVYKIKKKLKEEQLNLVNQLAIQAGEQQVLERSDFNQPLNELMDKITNVPDHENVEFCLNSCIRNQFKNVLFISQTTPYEVITLSHKAKAHVFVEKNNFDYSLYLEVNQIFKFEHQLDLIDALDFNQKYDAILNLSDCTNADLKLEQYWPYLKARGMFIFANTKKYKKDISKLVKKITKIKCKYDILKWHNGFVTIVKS